VIAVGALTPSTPEPLIALSGRGLTRAAGAALLVLLALVAASPSSSAGEPTAARLIAASNAARAGRGLPALAVSDRLSRAARAYAHVLSAQGKLAHSGVDGSDIVSRAETAAYSDWTFLGEDLARGPASTAASEIVAGWLASPPHRANLLSTEARDTGAGCATGGKRREVFCVLLFGSRSR
jgi:uncharacterized protein YkwD